MKRKTEGDAPAKSDWGDDKKNKSSSDSVSSINIESSTHSASSIDMELSPASKLPAYSESTSKMMNLLSPKKEEINALPSSKKEIEITTKKETEEINSFSSSKKEIEISVKKEKDALNAPSLTEDEILKTKLTRTQTQLEIQTNKLTRTNSVHINKEGVAEPITYSTRNYVGGSYDQLKEKQDGIKIAVVSQEAFLTKFSKKYHTKLRAGQKTGGTIYKSFKGTDESAMDKNIKDELRSKIDYQTVTEHADAFPILFNNKEKPHVIAVVEGERDALVEEFTLDEGEYSYTYRLHKEQVIGKDCNDQNDAKQNMHFYVRTDMTKITPTQTDIKVKGHGSFRVGEIQFATDKGDEYSVLVTHIPNYYIEDSTRVEATKEAFKEHAKDSKRKVMGYIGDTNYPEMIQPNSSPSTGGNQGEKFLSTTSSGAKGHTYYMQGISLGTGTDKDTFLMTQPSKLNDVNLKLKDYKTATDHPSIQTTFLVNGTIIGRDPSQIGKAKKVEEGGKAEKRVELDDNKEEEDDEDGLSEHATLGI